MPDRVCSLSLLPLRSRFQSRSGRFSISGSHLAAFSIGNRSSTPRVLHKIPHRVQRSRFRLLPGFLKKRSYFLKLFPSDITRGLFAHTRCVELLVSRVLYHFVTQSLQVRRAETLFILHFQWITALEERSWNLPGISPLKP